MNKDLRIILYLGIFIVIAGISSCSKIEKGFLSSNLYYIENPLTTSKGSVKVSASLFVDGSTLPMSVELTKLVDSAGNDVRGVLTKEDSIQGFSGNVTYLDSNLSLLSKKIVTTAAKPFSVNPSGGRIELTPATQYIPTGQYTMSVRASNIRGSIDLPNACTIIITSSGDPYVNYGGYYGGTFDINTGSYFAGVGVASPLVQYISNNVNKIVYKFVDKNGKVYDPKTGGIFARNNRWSMRQFDPYYPEILTDTSVEYQFPTVPNQFPIFSNPGVGGVIPRGNYGVMPAIPASQNSTGNPVFVFLDMAFFAKGTFIVTVNFTDLSWK